MWRLRIFDFDENVLVDKLYTTKNRAIKARDNYMDMDIDIVWSIRYVKNRRKQREAAL